ncbi:hypothetical protein V5799_031875 [Amblyomma americanum]|uniref:Uncharacterized protein n=1 Tax=Amblyomma americanum TaxID=6943 RepID=A0AAQ4DSS6_AMBAM
MQMFICIELWKIVNESCLQTTHLFENTKAVAAEGTIAQCENQRYLGIVLKRAEVGIKVKQMLAGYKGPQADQESKW